MILNRAGTTRIVMVSACMFSSENIVYEDGKKACRGSLNGIFWVVFSRGNSSRPRHTILTGLGAPYRYTQNLVLWLWKGSNENVIIINL